MNIKVGDKYYFFDDGKTSPSRCHVAEVKEIIEKKEAKNRFFETRSLYDIWKEEVDNHRQGKNFKVLGADQTIGAPWLYAEETDYFIACSIPDYDENLIWFVRDIDDGWFSIDVQNSWQSGSLDVTGKIFERAKLSFDASQYDGYYESLLVDSLNN